MKRIFKHPAAPTTGKKYWRSLEEFADTPEFRARLAREFPQGAAELEGDEISRRGFMQFMGASLALAGIGLTGCRRPELHGVPYTKGVEWQIPGVALHYATAMPRRGGALPLIATSYNGRPTKLEGNPNVPGFNGSTDAFAQAAILDLYDPDRSKVVLKAKDRGRDYAEGTMEDFWEEFVILRHYYQKNGGDGLAILTEPSTSPTRARLQGLLQQAFPKMLWTEYDPWMSQSAVGPVVYDLEKADVIVSLDCDFLGPAEGTVQSIAGFAAGRRRLGKTQETMSRLYTIEGRLSLTGSMADHRLRVPSSSIGGIVDLLASKLGAGAGNSFGAFNDPKVDAWITAMAADLTNAKGRAVVLCGSQQPAAVHQAVTQINQALGAAAIYPQAPGSASPAGTITDLAGRIGQGTIKTLLILGGNPAFTAPAELGLGDKLARVEQVIHLGSHVNETAAVCTTHVPAAHFLESWGDAVAYDGKTYLSMQPLILPLYGGLSEIEVLGQLTNLPSPKGAEYIRETFAQSSGIALGAGQAFDNAWRQFVHDGFTASNFPPAVGSIVKNSPAPAASTQQPLQRGEYELNFTLGTIDDGRYANNGWLQEMPDQVTKLTWDNALLVSPKTATALGVNERFTGYRFFAAHFKLADCGRSYDGFPDGEDHNAGWAQSGSGRSGCARAA
jgi:MoCo/4Fe-4S cofactor protein with predicted Tat translocation signal